MSPKLYESLHIWNTEPSPGNVSRNGARHTLRTVWFRGHGRRSARHVVTSPLRFCSFAKTTSSSAGRKTVRNHWKYVTKWVPWKNVNHETSQHLRHVGAKTKKCLKPLVAAMF